MYKPIKGPSYIDLKVNGRLFPSWILANFKKYKLPEIFTSAEDPCNPKTSSKTVSEPIKKELRLYQLFVSKYLDYSSVYHDILLYHGLGSGKTATAINVYNVLYNYTPGWNVFILLKASLKSQWYDQLNEWLQKDDYEYRFKNIIFLNYDSPTADKQFMDTIKQVDSSKKSMYIIEECHNFIRNVYSNISSNKGKRAQIIYDYIIQDKTENPDTRVILLSGTPAVNRPFEFALLFNLLKPGIFTRKENDFNQYFVTTAGYERINSTAINMFQRRIMGLVSYYYGSTPDLFASKVINYVDVVMSEHQEDVYNDYEEIERRMAAKSATNQVYKSYTRQASNFVFPQISQHVNGQNRPRPSKFKLTKRDAEKIMEGKDVLKESKTESDKLLNTTKYKEAMELYISSLKKYLHDANKKDHEGSQGGGNEKGHGGSHEKDQGEDQGEDLETAQGGTAKYPSSKDHEKGHGGSHIRSHEKDYGGNYGGNPKSHTIMDDVKLFMEKYPLDFDKFHKEVPKKSHLYTAMHTCSAKMLNIIFNIHCSKGPVLVYSNYVFMEGLEIFQIYLTFFNYYNFSETKKYVDNKIGYTEYHGGLSMEDRRFGMKMFNTPENYLGKYIKIMLVSKAGAEGLNLFHVRQVHIMEPYWNEVIIEQMIGRGIRQCSHYLLPMEERTVSVYRYRSIKSKPNSWSTDQYIEDLARTKDGVIQSFLGAVKEVAIDCVLNKNINMLADQYRCFQFEETSLFDKNIGPAYKQDIYDDLKMNNGSNSTNSLIMRIRVMLIKAVILLSNPEDEGGSGPKYSSVSEYWYYDKTGVVYDKDLHYPVGRVGFLEGGLPMKSDKDVYIITYMIPIPLIEG